MKFLCFSDAKPNVFSTTFNVPSLINCLFGTDNWEKYEKKLKKKRKIY